MVQTVFPCSYGFAGLAFFLFSAPRISFSWCKLDFSLCEHHRTACGGIPRQAFSTPATPFEKWE
jgi:hypothetical protein